MSKPVLGPDGIGRSKAVDDRINDAFRACFRDKCGETVLDYLRSITVNKVGGPEVTSDHLRHLEGQRFLFQVIQQRIEKGEKSARVDNSPKA